MATEGFAVPKFQTKLRWGRSVSPSRTFLFKCSEQSCSVFLQNSLLSLVTSKTGEARM